MDRSIAIIGGCGHVGLPLGVKFALTGFDVTLVDCNAEAVATVQGGSFPFLEQNGDEQLGSALKAGLSATTDAAAVANAEVVVFVTGTPVDEHLNPKVSAVTSIFDQYLPHMQEGTLVVMRSTLYPGTMEHLLHRLGECEKKLQLAFCPERVSQGYALEEIDSLPQIISAFDRDSEARAAELFGRIAPELLILSPLEAEMAKLMANSWRYLEFAIANQFYMIAESQGVDFYRVFDAIRYKYPRAAGYKSPGFAAGPCLFKDTMQLASFFDNNFYMGHSAMLVNEGLANLVVQKAETALNGNLWGKKVGLLGMAFKANNDDIRESLSFKVKKGLEFQGASVLYHDPYLSDSSSLEDVLGTSDAVILCTPHREYSELTYEVPLIDVWGMYERSHLQVLPGNQS